MKIGYFDCFAGAGGDMIVASMLDAGLDGEFLKGQLATLGIKDLDIKISETKRGGLRAVHFEVTAAKKQPKRDIRQIKEIINKSKISGPAKQMAITIFERLAEAEAAVHGKAKSEVHFHEIGALDSIADIVSTSVGMHFFKEKGVKKFCSSALSIGGGAIKTTHGMLPVPAPATAKLIEGVPVTAGPAQVELLTPTAAAILTTITNEFCALPAMKIEKIGYGAGSLQSDEFPNVLRLIVGESAEQAEAKSDMVCLLETNVDDSSGEVIGYVSDKLFESGAMDVFTTPIYMKHNRPAVRMSVICRVEDVQKVERILFAEGITFGIRKQIMQRSKLARDFVTVTTEYGDIRIKTGMFDGQIVNAKPEFSDCQLAAQKYKIPVKAVLEAAMAAYRKGK